MHIGLPWWIGAGPPEEGIDEAAELGFDFVEISLDAPWPDELDALSLADRADDAGVWLGFHAPWRTQALAHPREELAQAAREVAQSCVATARAAEAAHVVFHVDARAFGSFPRNDVVQHGIESAHASLRALSRSAGDELAILVENTSPPVGTAAELATFLDPLPEVGFCLDPGHAAIVALGDPEVPAFEPEAWTDALGDRLDLLHLMDFVETDAGVRDHLLPGGGEADWEAIVEAARAVGCDRVLVEAFYADPQRGEIGADDWRKACERVAAV